MTYSDDILSKSNHKIGYRISFDGIETSISTHASISGAISSLVRPPDGSGTSLDRSRSLVMPGGFAAECFGNQQMISYFARRGGTTATLEEGIETTTTTLRLNEGTIFSPGSTIYVEKETIILGSISAGEYTGCFRGSYKSELQAHSGGAIASDRPRYWLGRRAKLYAVDLETMNEKAIRTGILSASPRFSNGVYQLSFVDMQREFNRKIFTGYQSQNGTIENVVSSNVEQNFDVKVSDIRQFSTTADGHVKINFGNSFAVFKIRPVQVSVANSSVKLILRTLGGWESDLLGYGGEVNSDDEIVSYFNSVPDTPEISIQSVGFVRGSPALCALMVTTSRNGDVQNGGFDLLPGTSAAIDPAATDLRPRRIGAGISQGWVDFASWEEYAEGESIVVLIDKTMSLIDFLEEIVFLLGGYVYINDDGRISFKKYLPAIPQKLSIDSYDEGEIINMARSIVDDESEVVSSALVEVDYDFASNKYMKTIEVAWASTWQTYGEGRSQIKISSRWLRTADSRLNTNLASSIVSEEDIVRMMDRVFARTSDGVLKIKISVPFKFSDLFRPGYIFKFSDSTLPSEGAIGFSNKQFEVVGINPNYQNGRVEVEAEEQPRGWLVAPAAFVDTYDAGTITAAFVLTGDEKLLFDSDPGFDFIEDCKVIIYQAAAVPSFSTSGVGVVSSTGVDSVTFSAAPTVVPAPGDLIVMDISVNTGNTNSTGADVEDHLFNADSSVSPPTLLSGAIVPNKWS